MVRIFSLALVTISLLVMTSCDEWLTVKPEGEVVLEDFWQEEGHVNQVLSACYRSLSEGDVLSKMLVWGELRSDNVTFGNNVPEDMYKILNVDISPKNGYNHWGSFYTVINMCNTFLHYAPGVVDRDPNFTESELKSLEAEVLTIRALAYFYLVRTFKKVPWIEEPSIDDQQEYNIPQSSEEVVLQNIEGDLLTALAYARDKFEKTEYNKGRVTKNAVRAILADIYLWQGNYQACIEMCDQILDDREQGLELVEGKDVL